MKNYKIYFFFNLLFAVNLLTNFFYKINLSFNLTNDKLQNTNQKLYQERKRDLSERDFEGTSAETDKHIPLSDSELDYRCHFFEAELLIIQNIAYFYHKGQKYNITKSKILSDEGMLSNEVKNRLGFTGFDETGEKADNVMSRVKERIYSHFPNVTPTPNYLNYLVRLFKSERLASERILREINSKESNQDILNYLSNDDYIIQILGEEMDKMGISERFDVKKEIAKRVVSSVKDML